MVPTKLLQKISMKSKFCPKVGKGEILSTLRFLGKRKKINDDGIILPQGNFGWNSSDLFFIIKRTLVLVSNKGQSINDVKHITYVMSYFSFSGTFTQLGVIQIIRDIQGGGG